MSQPVGDSAGPKARLPFVENPTDPAAKKRLDEVLERTGRVLNLHRMMAHAPGVMEGSHVFAMALRYAVELPRSLVELAILRTAQICRSAYEWEQHVPMALGNGVTQEQIDALADWQSSGLYSDVERAVLAYASAVAADRQPSPEEFADLSDRFSPREIVELTMIVCHYIMISRFISALGIPLETEA